MSIFVSMAEAQELQEENNLALEFGGSNDFVVGSGVDLANSDFTLELWFNLAESQIGNNQSLFSLGSSTGEYESIEIKVQGTDQIRVALGSDNVNFPWEVEGGWHHIAVVQRVSNRKLSVYIDGMLLNTKNIEDVFNGNSDFAIGTIATNPGSQDFT